MLDAGTVELDILRTGMPSPAHALGHVENIMIEPERRARVVVDQHSGTIVMGEDVRISRVAVSQGNLILRVEEAPVVVQAEPVLAGRDGDRPAHGRCDRGGAGHRAWPRSGGGASLSEVVAGLNALGVSPRDMIDILKSIKAAGALHAEFIVR